MMQRYIIIFIIVNALHVSGGFSAHHQELKNCIHSIWYVPSFLAAKFGTYQMGGETARNMQSIDNNIKCCILLVVLKRISVPTWPIIFLPFVLTESAQA